MSGKVFDYRKSMTVAIRYTCTYIHGRSIYCTYVHILKCINNLSWCTQRQKRLTCTFTRATEYKIYGVSDNVSNNLNRLRQLISENAEVRCTCGHLS